jgi:hypothetical protein
LPSAESHGQRSDIRLHRWMRLARPHAHAPTNQLMSVCNVLMVIDQVLWDPVRCLTMDDLMHI